MINRLFIDATNRKISLLSSGFLTEAILKNYYHGTGSAFDKFSKPGYGKHGIGYYFTPDEKEARYFAKSLAGSNEKEKRPRVIEVQLNVSNPFKTMSVEDAEKVANNFDYKYRKPKFAGGAKEHYQHLELQLKKMGIVKGPAGKSDFNNKIKESGFDAVEYDTSNHLIVFDPKQIKIVSSYFLDER